MERILQSEEVRLRLLKQAAELPLSPGIYLMKDKSGRVIYVGKSKRLKNRVSQYFQNNDKNPKTERMVSLVHHFDTILCDTEIEALSLENSLIKQYSPKYNIRLKDAKSYPYIKISAEEYPRIQFTRQRDKDKARYFGPYSGAGTAYRVLDALRKTLGLPSCKLSFPEDIGKARPCLYYQMGRCKGLCTGRVTKEEHDEQIRYAVDILRGNTSALRTSLEEQMLDYADREEYEAAARCRDTMLALDALREKQKVVAAPGTEQDVIGYYADNICATLSVMQVRDGRVNDLIDFPLGADAIAEESDLVAFISSYYKQSAYIPKTVLLSFTLTDEENDLLASYLSSLADRKISVRTPERGELKKLCDLAETNARERTNRYRSDMEKDDKTLLRLAELLCLESLPERIEAYDISNYGKDHKTAGMIVSKNGKFSKGDYRSFSIRSVEGTDDYACMAEALRRRLSHLDDDGGSFSEYPDLILLDGGHGHVSTVKEVLRQMNVDIPVFGMVKDDYHKTRALCTEHEEIHIAKERQVFLLIYKMQEEVHRYSLSRMQSAKRSTLKKSSLEKIKGIGEAKSQRLLKAFGGIGKLKTASVTDISAVKGISVKDAEAVYAHFHKAEVQGGSSTEE